MDYTVVVVRRRVRPVAVQVPRPVRRLRHGPALDGDRRARPGGLRRPVQAGRGLPADLAAAAPPAGPRGLPRRRVLPAQPAARAGRQAVRRERRRLADRPAGHRDQGRRHLGLHPHQRDLDHRRPDLPAGRPVQVGCPAGLRHRPVGVPRGRRRPDQGDEEGRGHAQGRPVAVPGARVVRGLRVRARQGVAGPARPGLPPRRAAQAAAQQPDARRGAGGVAVRRHQRLPRRRAGRPRCGGSSPSCSTGSAAATRHWLDGIRSTGDIDDVADFEGAIKGFAEQFSWEQAADRASAAARGLPGPRGRPRHRRCGGRRRPTDAPTDTRSSATTEHR